MDMLMHRPLDPVSLVVVDRKIHARIHVVIRKFFGLKNGGIQKE